MVQLAWRFLMFQKDSASAQWFRARTENARGTRKLMIVAPGHRATVELASQSWMATWQKRPKKSPARGRGSNFRFLGAS
jgi:hypothetical protein